MRRIVLPAQALRDGPTALRPWRDSDIGALVFACQDPEISRWTRVPSPYGESDARAYLLTRHDAIHAGRMAPFAIVHRSEPDDSRAAQPDDSRAAQPDDSRAAQPDDSRGAQPDDSRAAQPDDSRAARSGEAGSRAGGMREGEAGSRAGGMREGELLGSISLMRPAWEHARMEVGYWLAREARGQGHATRALALICAWGLYELGLERLDLLAGAENTSSQRVAQRAGFTREAVLRSYVHGRDGPQDMVCFGLLAGEEPDPAASFERLAGLAASGCLQRRSK